MGRDYIGLVEACDDPRLLNFPLWPRQREILAAVDGGPRLHVLALGRRSGKTTMAALVAVHDCLLRPHVDRYVRPREKRYSVSVATSQRQASIFLDAARGIVEVNPMLARMIAEVRDDELLFTNRTAIQALPATARGLRGLPVSSLLFDEAAHMLDGDGNACAEPMWRSVAPGLSQFGEHGRALIASTPWGTEGWFASVFERAAAGELDGAAAYTATSAEMNPTLDADFLRAEFERDPEGFAGEYEARFTASGGAYIDPERLRACVAGRGDLGRDEATGWVIGADLGFARDPAGIVAVGRENEHPGRLRVGLVRRWQPERSTTFEERRAVEDRVVADLAEVASYYGATVVVDQHLAPQVRAELRRRGVHVVVLALTAESKSLAFAELSRLRRLARTSRMMRGSCASSAGCGRSTGPAARPS